MSEEVSTGRLVGVHSSSLFSVEKTAELQQAIVRIGFTVLVGLYVYGIYLYHWFGGISFQAIICISFYTIFSILNLVWNIVSPSPNTVRRFTCITLDVACTTYIMIVGGVLLAGLYGGYLWVSIANGLRFGKLYMKVAYIQSVVGFSLVILLSDFWQNNLVIAIGLWVWILLLPLYVYRLLTILEDAIIETEKANQSKSHFLANMSHEMRTPLTAIIGFAEEGMVRNGEGKGSALQVIKQSGDHLLSLINELLDFSKVEANELKINETQCSLFDITENVKNILQRTARKKNINFSIEYYFPLPDIIIIDPLRLKQILINLCSNAIKFTEDGYVKLRVSYKKENDVLTFSVVDSGVGMSDEDMKTIFQPFKQIDSSLTRRYTGTGLGLAISKKLSTLLGGELDVKSKPGEGTEFLLMLRNIHVGDALIRAIPEIETHIESRELENVGSDMHGEVLIVEDNEMNQRLLFSMLGRMGVSLTLVSDGESAIVEAMNSDFDLILMDIQMPVLSGIEAVKRLRDMGYTRPVVALTANALSASQQSCIDAGFDDFMTKPIVKSTLYNICKRYLYSAKNDDSRIVSEILEQEPELADLVYDFVERLPGTLEAIKVMVSEKNWHTLSVKVHDLKGLGGAFGYPEVTQLAIEMERSLRAQESLKVAESVDKLENIIERISAGIRMKSEKNASVVQS